MKNNKNKTYRLNIINNLSKSNDKEKLIFFFSLEKTFLKINQIFVIKKKFFNFFNLKIQFINKNLCQKYFGKKLSDKKFFYFFTFKYDYINISRIIDFFKKLNIKIETICYNKENNFKHFGFFNPFAFFSIINNNKIILLFFIFYKIITIFKNIILFLNKILYYIIKYFYNSNK